MLAAAAVALVGIAGVLYVAIGPDASDSSDNPRFRAGVVVLSLSEPKAQVERFAQDRGTLDGAGAGLKLERSSYISRAVVSDRGSLVAFDSRNEFVVSLEPSLVGNRVEWRCTVVPAKMAPGPCRPK
jgi:hypothetical protein